MIRLYATAAVCVVAAGLGATWYLSQSQPGFENCGATQIGGEIGGPLELLNSKGETVTEKEIFTEPSLLYFGYTFCPDVCPLHVSRNADAIDILAEKGLSATPVFISIDPERDTPEAVGDFAFNLHEKMIGLTGSLEQTDAASKTYKTYYKAQKDGTDEYLVDHSTFTYLVFPDRGFVEFFRHDVTAEQMAERTACFIENS